MARKTSCPRRRASSNPGPHPLDARLRGHDTTPQGPHGLAVYLRNGHLILFRCNAAVSLGPVGNNGLLSVYGEVNATVAYNQVPPCGCGRALCSAIPSPDMGRGGCGSAVYYPIQHKRINLVTVRHTVDPGWGPECAYEVINITANKQGQQLVKSTVGLSSARDEAEDENTAMAALIMACSQGPEA